MICQDLNIIRDFIKDYSLPLYPRCGVLKEVDCTDILSQYLNPILLSKGGQRVVYRVNHPTFGQVVLKIGNYRSSIVPDGWDIERIEREIGILQQIDSEYYPKNYQFEKLPDGRYIIIEEFIDSTPFMRCMDRFQNPASALILIKSLVAGLTIIWDKNIVHRDLKPDNILITSAGLPKIIDLGIARSLDSTTITQHLAAGPCTPCYAAPELLHYDKKLIDKRTDQYNLGIILVQLLLKSTHPFDPTLVGGISIPYNILSDNWYRDAFKKSDLSPIFPIASKLLGFQQYQRFRSQEKLLNEIGSCLRLYS